MEFIAIIGAIVAIVLVFSLRNRVALLEQHIAFLNQHSDAPKPLPAAPPEAAVDAKTPETVPGTDAEAGEKEGVMNEQQAVTGGQKNIGGEGAPKLTGTEPTKKN